MLPTVPDPDTDGTGTDDNTCLATTTGALALVADSYPAFDPVTSTVTDVPASAATNL